MPGESRDLSGPIRANRYAIRHANREHQEPLNRGCFKRSGLVLPLLSFLVLFGTFLGFSRFAHGWSGIFPICPSPFSRPIKSTYEEQSRKGPRHNLDLPEKSGKHPGLETPRFSLSQEYSLRIDARSERNLCS